MQKNTKTTIYNNMENLKSPSKEITDEKKVDLGESSFEVKQNSQEELMLMVGGDTVALDWINSNAKRFDELINDPKFNFIERLANKDTHNEALLEIRGKLYH